MPPDHGQHDIVDTLKDVLRVQGKLDPERLGEHDDLYQAGMTSFASVNVMLALEDTFDVEFPDRMLTRDVFESIASIRGAVSELLAKTA